MSIIYRSSATHTPKRTPLTAQQIGEHDLRHAAIHEAAHAVVAQCLGYPASPEIFATPDPGPDDKLWIGKTTFYRDLGGLDERLICLAGTVAEQVDGDPNVEAEELIDWLEFDAIELSATDAQGAGDYGIEDLKNTLILVRHLWEEIDMRAKHLIRRYAAT